MNAYSLGDGVPGCCLEGLSQKGLRKRREGGNQVGLSLCLFCRPPGIAKDPTLLPGHLQLHPWRLRKGSRTEHQIPFLGHVAGREVAAAVGTDRPSALWGLATWEWLGAGSPPPPSLVILAVSEGGHR